MMKRSLKATKSFELSEIVNENTNLDKKQQEIVNQIQDYDKQFQHKHHNHDHTHEHNLRKKEEQKKIIQAKKSQTFKSVLGKTETFYTSMVENQPKKKRGS